MTGTILVAYATHHGSTREVAEKIAALLQETGFAVEVHPARRVRTIGGYCAVILGAPLYMFRLHKDARRFLSRNRKNLPNIPAAVFALGPMNNVEKEFREARIQLDKALQKFPWMKAKVVELFGGKVDPLHFRFPYNIIPGLKKLPSSDIRDWTAIREWAERIPQVLGINKP